MSKKRGDKFQLLIYARMWQRWAWPSILIIPASAALWWYSPTITIISQRFRMLTLAPALVAFLILAYAFWARKRSWVQCRQKHLYIQTPFYPIAVSYGRIQDVRPQQFSHIFDPAQEKPARRRWLRPYWGKTVLAVDLSSYPIGQAWLRLWLSPYVLNPPGLVLLVDDWMALSRQIDDFRTARDMRRAQRRQSSSPGLRRF
jgi:hypothetical protein